MRILFTIPHFYRPEENAPFGSLEKNPSNRIRALTATILSLYQTFHFPHCIMNLGNQVAVPANQQLNSTIDIVICTTGSHHVLSQLPIPNTLYRHISTNASPRQLGFECHSVLRDLFGQYDFYCFLEDDLVIHDPYFFQKLLWFSQQTTSVNLLQPNRYEVHLPGLFKKGYIDGEISKTAASHLQNITDQPQLAGQFLGHPLYFRRTTNPHSGCFFLHADQMEYWLKQSYFLDRDESFVDPMASAATLGITKTFKVYKPSPQNAAFLEIEHVDRRYLWQVGSTVGIDKQAFQQLGYNLYSAAK